MVGELVHKRLICGPKNVLLQVEKRDAAIKKLSEDVQTFASVLGEPRILFCQLYKHSIGFFSI